jgi:hypothetical protein
VVGVPELPFVISRARGLVAMATAAAVLLGLASSADAADRTALTRVNLGRISAGVNNTTYAIGGFVAVPSSWSLRRSASAIRLRDRDFASCIYDVTITAQAIQSSATSPAEQIVAQQNVDPSYVIDSGTRGRGAWRIVRQPGGSSKGVTVVGDLLLPHPARGGSGGGTTTWVGLHAVASARAGSECHSGTYRQAVGPQLGDAFASFRGIVHSSSRDASSQAARSGRPGR